jgi:PHD/YefM family antitoxin component YafN of YafNO toxin-antitoxin module
VGRIVREEEIVRETVTRHVPYKDFAKAWERSSSKPVRIKRNEDARVLMSEEEYETLMLLRGNNRKELLEAIADADAGKLVEHKLIRK